MKIVAKYSFNNGENAIKEKYSDLLIELDNCIRQIDASKYKTIKSKEKTMKGKMLYAPKELNKAFKSFLNQLDWYPHREICEYSIDYYVEGYAPESNQGQMKPYREMDFIKRSLGVEVQFGKYAFMVYNVCAKMTIFSNLGLIDTGVEIVPVKAFAKQMSTGVSYFEQFVWD